MRRMTLAGGSGTVATASAPTTPAANIAVSTAPTARELSDAMNGRITLAVVNLVLLGLLGFYVWTRGAQGGG